MYGVNTIFSNYYLTEVSVLTVEYNLSLCYRRRIDGLFYNEMIRVVIW